MKIRINNKGKLISVYWFAMLFVVAAGVSYLVVSFYGTQQDIRTLEQNALADKIADCISQGGYLNDDVLSSGFKSDFAEACGIDFTTEDFSNWKDSPQYYAEIDFNEFNKDKPDGFGDALFAVNAGNPNLKLNIPIMQIPAKKLYAVDKNSNQYAIKITAIVGKEDKNK